MATSKYPDDIAQDFETEERLFDFIDDEIPTQQSNAIRGQNIRNTLKSLFKTLLPGGEKEYKYNLNFFKLLYSGQLNNKYYFELIVNNQSGGIGTSGGGEYFKTAAILKLKESSYYSLFPMLNTGYGRGQTGSTQYAFKSFSNIKLSFDELYYDDGHIYIEVTEGQDELSTYTDAILVTSDKEIPIKEKKKNINGYDYVFEKLVIPDDCDSVELCINDYSSCHSTFYPIVLSYIEYENINNAKNGKKLKFKLKGGYEEMNGFFLNSEGSKIDGYQPFYRSKIYKKEGNNYIDVTTYGSYPTEDTTYYIRDINNNYVAVNLFNDGRFNDVSESSRPSCYADSDKLCVMTFGVNSNIPDECITVKLHHTPNLFFYPPSYYNTQPLDTIGSGNYIYENKVMYDFDQVTMDKDFSINGVYSMSGYAYSYSSSLYGIKDSYLEFTLWDNKWFINGITF